MTAQRLSLELMLMIAVGLFARKSQIVSGDFNRQLSSFITKLALPCMIVNSMRGTASLAQLKSCGVLVLLALLMLAVEFVLGQLAYRLAGGGYSARILRFGMVFTNFTFMGIPVVEALYGSEGVFYFVVFLVPIRMVYYSSAKPLLSPPELVQEKISLQEKLKGWFSPPVAAVFVGLLLYLTGWHLPAVMEDVVSSIGGVCSPLGMLLCGISLGQYEFRSLLRGKYLLLPLLRNLAVPAVFFCLARLLPVSWELARLMVVCAALPVSSLTAAFTVQYDPEPEAHFESAGVVFLSTLLSAVTIPFWAYVLSLS